MWAVYFITRASCLITRGYSGNVEDVWIFFSGQDTANVVKNEPRMRAVLTLCSACIRVLPAWCSKRDRKGALFVRVLGVVKRGSERGLRGDQEGIRVVFRGSRTEVATGELVFS